VSWDDVGDAIQDAIQRASGLAAGRVIWKNQDINARQLDYVAIDLGGMIPIGIDGLITSTNTNRPRGEEIQISTIGVRECSLSVECFTASAISGREASAMVLCSKIYSGMLLPSIRAILYRADVSVFDVSQISWIPDVPSRSFRGRAVGELRCYMPAPTVSEYAGYIERVSGTVTVLGAVGSPSGITRPFDTAATAPGDEDQS
jgi:hypothetical protein